MPKNSDFEKYVNSLNEITNQENKAELESFYTLHSSIFLFFKGIDNSVQDVLKKSNVSPTVVKQLANVLPTLTKLKKEISRPDFDVFAYGYKTKISQSIAHIKNEMTVSEVNDTAQQLFDLLKENSIKLVAERKEKERKEREQKEFEEAAKKAEAEKIRLKQEKELKERLRKEREQKEKEQKEKERKEKEQKEREREKKEQEEKENNRLKAEKRRQEELEKQKAEKEVFKRESLKKIKEHKKSIFRHVIYLFIGIIIESLAVLWAFAAGIVYHVGERRCNGFTVTGIKVSGPSSNGAFKIDREVSMVLIIVSIVAVLFCIVQIGFIKDENKEMNNLRLKIN